MTLALRGASSFVATTPPTEAARAPLRRDVQFTPEQYFYLSGHNMLGEGRTELIDGRIVHMPAQYDTHAWAVSECADWLQENFPKRKYWVRVQMTLQCSDHVPEPNLAVIDGPRVAVRSVMTGDRALLVVEVADATLLADKRIKPRIYAEAGVPDYWVIDVKNRTVLVHRQPRQERDGRWSYASVVPHDTSRTIATLKMPKCTIKVSKLFPPLLRKPSQPRK